ncbi:MAG: hypothetical protein ACRC33_02955 [Gemmataceae bacterium]
MATTTNPKTSGMQQSQEIGVEDVFPVRSRISWGAIVAGAVVALSCYFVLILLGTAIGVTTAATTDTPVTDRGVAYYATGAVIWATLAMLVSLYAGGCVAGQLSVGETRNEAIVYGVVVWGTVVAMQMLLMSAGAKSGFSAMVAGANLAAEVAPPADEWESSARRAGIPQDEITKFRDSVREKIEKARETMNDPEQRRAALRGATATAWFALVAVVVALAASIAGAVQGSGPEMRLVVRNGRLGTTGVVRT